MKEKKIVTRNTLLCKECGVDVFTEGESYYISSSDKPGGSAILCWKCWKAKNRPPGGGEAGR